MEGRIFVRASLIAMIALILGACASKPTRVQENLGRNMGTKPGERVEIKIDEATIVLDARPAFEFTLSHIPRAIPLSWADFTQNEEATRGVLQPDRFALARRLARVGVTPESKVVVVGRGARGEGEEGRLAWTLAYLGVKNVAAVPMEYFKGPLTSRSGTPPQPVTIWKPDLQEGLLVTREELLKVINKGGVYKPIRIAKELPERTYRIIDVRTPREYLGKEGIGLATQIPNMDAINISWTEFFGPDGRANPRIAEQLRQIGVDGSQRLLIISERGLRSAAVTLALRELGFTDVGNYAGGLRDLINAYQNKPKTSR